MRADARRNRERILRAADDVFAERGPSASTEEVAARAGVAIGTVFRHFPTKKELLQAIVGELVSRLTEEARALIAGDDPAAALFEFFTRMVEQAARHKTVVDLLADRGIDIEAGKPLRALRDSVETLLGQAKAARGVRADLQLDEVMALLTATTQAAMRTGWNDDLQRRTLAIVFDGLRPAR